MKKDIINNILSNLKLDANCVNYFFTSSSDFYDISLGNGCTLNKFCSLVSEIEFRLKTPNKLFFKIIPEEGIIRIQDLKSQLPSIDVLSLISIPRSGFIPVTLGLDYSDNVIKTDFVNHPHTLIAGTTGSGKTSALHSIILNSLNNKNNEIYLSDPKGFEFNYYSNLPQVKQTSSSLEESIDMLHSLCSIMESRFRIMKKNMVSNYLHIPGSQKTLVIIDEISDLLLEDSSGEFENLLIKLSQKSRAAGIHIVAATQRPSADILSGQIKANFPSRIALKTASSIDSRVILDDSGAELLTGNGDALVKTPTISLTRFRFPSINTQNIKQYLSEII
jgi:S-DNA-T family DNA segregation ATPase FtsK/SpoIIIE